MATLKNTTCVKLENVVKSGVNVFGRYDLYVKGEWLPTEFSLSICDGTRAWTVTASKDLIQSCADDLLIAELEFVDRAHSYFSKQHFNTTYELKHGKNMKMELCCYKGDGQPREQHLILPLVEAETRDVAVEMMKFLWDAHASLNEQLDREARSFERIIAAKDQSLSILKKEKIELELAAGLKSLGTDANGQPVAGEDEDATPGRVAEESQSRGKRKGMISPAETGSRKKNPKGVGPSDAAPALAYQKPASPQFVVGSRAVSNPEVSASLPPPLSLLGYKQPKVGEEEEEEEEPAYLSWLNKGKVPVDPELHTSQEMLKANGVTEREFLIVDESLADEHRQPVRHKKPLMSLDDLSDVADVAGKYTSYESPPTAAAKKSTSKKQKKSGASKSNKKQPAHSLDASLDGVDAIVEKGIKLVDTLGTPPALALEVSSPLVTPGKQGKVGSGKKSLKPAAKKSNSRSLKKVPKKREVVSSPEVSNDEGEPSEEPEINEESAFNEVEEERTISVQNAEFHDFDESRTQEGFAINQYWALYDDQDGMPRFYGRITKLHDPFKVSVEWLEPLKPSVPANGLVKTAGLSAACGDFKIGSICLQDLPAFSHKVDIEKDNKKGCIKISPAQGEIWALYRFYNQKQAKAVDENEEVKFEYDLVEVQDAPPVMDNVKVLPLTKLPGFKSVFTRDDDDSVFYIPAKQLQARFSHQIPRYELLGSETPGLPVGALELDPASTPAEYLGR